MRTTHIPMAFCLLLVSTTAFGYAEFHAFVEQHSGRTANCAMCHTHPDGPEGLKPGQIGSLTAEQLGALNRARGVFEPGQEVANPILNDFGDLIMHQLGKQRLLALRQQPEQLAKALGNESDLDGDGIPDAEEYLAGTHPLNRESGDPARLFWVNLARNAFHVVMLLLATVAGVYGLNHLVRGFEAMEGQAKDDGA